MLKTGMRIPLAANLTACIGFAAIAFAMVGSLQAEEAPVADKPAATGSAKKEASATKSVEPQTMEPQILKLADGKLLLPVPGNWKAVKPKNRIIRHEFAIAPAKSDDAAGRMTIMPSGGGVEANIARWVGQFQTADGKPLGDDAKKIEKREVGEVTVHVVDLTGNYQDSMRGPFGPKVSRPDYRMLAAIVPLKEGGTWFIKSYGPQATMKVAEKDFAKMIEGVKLAN